MYMLDIINTKSTKTEREFDTLKVTFSIILRETYNSVVYEPYIIISLLGSVITLIVRLSVEFLVPLSVYSQFVHKLGDNPSDELREDAIKKGENYLYVL